MKTHVTTLFLAWTENKLSTGEKNALEIHLENCEECRRYYEKMKRALSEKVAVATPMLALDPFLPTRVKALATAKAPGRLHLAPVLRISAASLTFCVAIAIGIFLGKGLVKNESGETSSVDSFSSYYSVLSQQDFASGSWQSTVESAGKTSTTTNEAVSSEAKQ